MNINSKINDFYERVKLCTQHTSTKRIGKTVHAERIGTGDATPEEKLCAIFLD